ncbi:MAG: glycosyltransferase, partial [Leptolyngbyaceae cyanobacterium]
ISNLPYVNFVSLAAKYMSRSRTKVIAVEHIPIYENNLQDKQLVRLFSQLIVGQLYRGASRIICVSESMKEAFLREHSKISKKVLSINNPVVDEKRFDAVNINSLHPWLAEKSVPVALIVSRLSPEKDLMTAIDAFYYLRERLNLKLIILGEGSEAKRLKDKVKVFEYASDVDFLGHVSNPEVYMCFSDILLLSSIREGLPTVIIEALACGCNVVSTDCPFGPREILCDGKYGWLVPVGNVQQLAVAMQDAIENPKDPEMLKSRAQDFHVSKAIAAYTDLINEVCEN